MFQGKLNLMVSDLIQILPKYSNISKGKQLKAQHGALVGRSQVCLSELSSKLSSLFSCSFYLRTVIACQLFFFWQRLHPVLEPHQEKNSKNRQKSASPYGKNSAPPVTCPHCYCNHPTSPIRFLSYNAQKSPDYAYQRLFIRVQMCRTNGQQQ